MRRSVFRMAQPNLSTTYSRFNRISTSLFVERIIAFHLASMTRIVGGKIVSEEEALKRYGPFRFIVAFFLSIFAFIKLFFQSIFNPQAMSNYRRGPGSDGSGGGRKGPMIHRIKAPENCRAGS